MYHYTYNCDDLDGTEPELEFAKEPDTKVVDGEYCDEKYGDPDSWIDLISSFPFLDDQSRGGELIWRGDDVLAPIRPAKCKPESRVDEAGSIASETGGVRNPGGHFTESRHDDVDEETNSRISNENRTGTRVC
jgi:hypothetical protein